MLSRFFGPVIIEDITIAIINNAGNTTGLVLKLYSLHYSQ